jgi:HSP20 family protein
VILRAEATTDLTSKGGIEMLSLFNTLPALDRVFDDMMRTSSAFPSPQMFGRSVEAHALEDRLSIEFEIPGVKAEDLSVEIEANVLRVRGERKPRNGESTGRMGTYSWAYALPEGYDTDAMKASLADGVLTVDIPRHPKTRPRKIQVLSSSPEPKQIVEGGSASPEVTETRSDETEQRRE